MFLGIDIGTSGVKAVGRGRGRRRCGAGERAAWRLAPAAAVVRAGPRGLVERDLSGRARRSIRRLRRTGAGHRACRPDARRDAARCRRPALRPAILWNDGRSFAECAELEAAVPDSRGDHRQSRHAGLHRAQARVAAAPRAGDLRADPHGAAAQGLCPPADDGRQGLRHVGQRRARSGSMSPRATGRTACWPRPG